MSNPAEGGVHPPGWYPDPERPGQERFWYGTQWSPQVRTPGTRAPQTAGSVWSQPWNPPAPPESATQRHTGRVVGICVGVGVLALVVVVIAVAPSGKSRTAASTTVSAVPVTSAASVTAAPAAPATTATTGGPTAAPATTGGPSTTVRTAAPLISSDEGTLYELGEYCRSSDLGKTTTVGDGKTITCEIDSGDRWVDS